jgi:hypothetical protein
MWFWRNFELLVGHLPVVCEGNHENFKTGKPAGITFKSINRLVLVTEVQWVFYDVGKSLNAVQ